MSARIGVHARAGLFIPLVAGFVVGVAVVAAAGSSLKVPADPDAGLSDAQRQKVIDQFKERNFKWAQDFSDQGRDPRALPVVDFPTYSGGASSIEEARAASDVVVVGTVISTTYEPDLDGLTHSIATVRVESVAKGDAPATIQVLQVGGPAWNEAGGELQQLEGDPLLLPGQDVMLVLTAGNVESEFQTVYGAGVYLITSGKVEAPHDSAVASQVDGLSLDAALALFK